MITTMIFADSGKLTDEIYVLGPPWIPTILVDAPQPALFDAGFAALGLVYQREIQKALGQRQPAYMFVTHSHFDHCGAVPHLKKAFPGLRAAAATRAARVWAKPSAQKVIAELNAFATQEMLKQNDEPVNQEPWSQFDVELLLEDGQEIDLGGGLSVVCVATPGHTRDCISYYIPQRKMMVSSEAAGISYQGGQIFAEFLVDFDLYVQSIQRIRQLDIEIFCQGHGMIFIGRDEVERRLAAAVDAAYDFKEMVLELLRQEGGDQERVMELVKKREYDPLPGPKQEEAPYLLNLRAKVSCLAKEAGL